MTSSGKYLLAAALAVALAASAAPAAESGVPNRLSSAKVGEWATYRLPDGYIQKQTVIRRDGTGPEALVTIRIENIYNGSVVNSVETQEQAGPAVTPPQVPDQPGMQIEITVKNVSVKGRNIAATVLEIENDNGDDDEETKWYLSADIPVFGIIRQEVDDKVVFELIDFGDK